MDGVDCPFVAVERPSDDGEQPSDSVEALGDADCPAEDADVIDEDSSNDSDFGDPELWDPHAGLKPSEADGCASDGNLESDDGLPYGAENEMNGAMVDMMVDMDEWDTRDAEWLPPNEQRKLAARKKGMSYCASRMR
jgi:hypothetical protein